MTQQQIFSLYLGTKDREQLVLNTKSGRKGRLRILDILISEEIGVEDVGYNYTYSNWKISDCKLILKRIADMSEDEKHQEKMLKSTITSHGFGNGNGFNLFMFYVANGIIPDGCEYWVENGWVEVV